MESEKSERNKLEDPRPIDHIGAVEILSDRDDYYWHLIDMAIPLGCKEDVRIMRIKRMAIRECIMLLGG